MKNLVISDPTLRDGNHAVGHAITLKQIKEYAKQADNAGVDIIEVGHGNGLGASSLQLGLSAETDLEILRTSRKAIHRGKLGIHIIPGFGKITENLEMAISEGVDVFRVASHCTEADTTRRYIDYLAKKQKETYGVLMMCHMADGEKLLEESHKMIDYGAIGIVLMDSAGALLPDDVKKRVATLADNLKINIGFHSHNNLGLAVANSVAAVESGAKIIDGTICGFGAGAGNAPIEIIVAVLKKAGYKINIDLYRMLDLADRARKVFNIKNKDISTTSIVSGLFGVFSGFVKPANKASKDYGVDLKEIFRLLGERKVIAGQEDLIIEVAQELCAQKKIKS